MDLSLDHLDPRDVVRLFVQGQLVAEIAVCQPLTRDTLQQELFHARCLRRGAQRVAQEPPGAPQALGVSQEVSGEIVACGGSQTAKNGSLPLPPPWLFRGQEVQVPPALAALEHLLTLWSDAPWLTSDELLRRHLAPDALPAETVLQYLLRHQARGQDPAQVAAALRQVVGSRWEEATEVKEAP